MNWFIVGIAIGALGTLFQVFNTIWDHYYKHVSFKGKRLIYLLFFVIIAVLSYFIGSGTFDITGPGKDTTLSLQADLEYIVQSTATCAICDNNVYDVFDYYPEYEIIVSNPNDLKVIIDNIDLIIDDYNENAKAELYAIHFGGMNVEMPFVFYGKLSEHSKKVRLYYWGDGYPEDFDYSGSNPSAGHVTLDANDQGVVIPYSPFSKAGLYTMHYEINYHLNGKAKKYVLPKETAYITTGGIKYYRVREDDLEPRYGISFEDFTNARINKTPISKDLQDKLSIFKSGYEEYYQERIYPMDHVCDY